MRITNLVGGIQREKPKDPRLATREVYILRSPGLAGLSVLVYI
jgi:hypothetical protein